MRILFITEYLPATDQAEITGGVEAYVHYVARHLERDHDVEVVARPTDGTVWDDASLGSMPARLRFLGRALVAGLRSRADVVIGTTYVVHPVAWLVAKLRRRPVVFWYPDVLIGTWRNGQFGRAAGLIGELIERVLLRLPVDRFIAISAATAGKLVANGVDRERIAVIPCGFEPSVVEAVQPEQDGDQRLTVVGRLVPYKRVDVVISALAELRDSHPALQLVVIGQGPERDALERLAAELGVSNRVELRGFVPRHTDVLAAIGGSAAFVSASEIEGFGIVVAEAMALGVPYAVSDIPAFREVTGGGVGGRLFPPGDAKGLAEALNEILGARGDRAAFADAGRRHARRYEWGAVARATAALLDETVTRRVAARRTTR